MPVNAMLEWPEDVQRRQRDRHIAPAQEFWIRQQYARSHPEDTYDDLVRRASFSRHDAGLLNDWIRAAREAVKETLAEEK
jgi:hypothetical protein